MPLLTDTICPFRLTFFSVGISSVLITLVPRLMVIVSFLGNTELFLPKTNPSSFMVDVPRLLVIVVLHSFYNTTIYNSVSYVLDIS